MQELRSHLCGRWQSGSDQGHTLYDPSTGEALARASTGGLDLSGALEHARSLGGPALRRLTFRERGELLSALSQALHAGREELLELSARNTGTTRSDAKFDVDGATATLMAYAELGRSMGDGTVLRDGDLEALGRSPRFSGGHVKVPLTGVAVHINAFNFPAWGLAEKLACAFLAGMPVLTKPATATVLPAHRCAELLVESGSLPEGAWSFLCGPVGDLLSHLGPQDVVAFTGSAATGERIRSLPNVTAQSIRVNVEADSLNAAVVGPDVEADSDTFKLFIHELFRELTQKTGQKCTATRRVFLPEGLVEPTLEALRERAAELRTGPPGGDGVRMGPLAAPAQLQDVLEGLKRLEEAAERVLGELPATDGPGAFVKPVVFLCRNPHGSPLIHELEVFGPVAVLAPYSGDAEEAVRLVAAGQGELVTSLYTEDLGWLGAVLPGVAPFSGRVLLGSRRTMEHSTGPGMVLPALAHGGPGRAGGGLELGGLRGLDLYLQTVAVQGPRPFLQRLLGFSGGS